MWESNVSAYAQCSEKQFAEIIFTMLEVVRLKFQGKWAPPGRFTLKVYGEQSCKSQLFKVITKENLLRCFQ